MPWVLFFDGDCALCNGSVRRLVKWDHEGVLHYAPLAGKLAEKHGLTRYLEGEEASMVLLNEATGEIRTQSEVLLQLLRLLGGFWRLFLVIAIVPGSLRDLAYRWLARNRRRFAGNPSSICGLPDETLRKRLRH